MNPHVSFAVDRTVMEIFAGAVGQVLGEHSKIHQFVKLAAERPSTMNFDRAKRTFDALPVYQRRRVAETAEGAAHRHKSRATMSSILGRLGGDTRPPRAVSRIVPPPAAAREVPVGNEPVKGRDLAQPVKEVVWK